MATRCAIGLTAAATILAATVVPVDAALITFNLRAQFDAANPGLPVETFETGLVGPGGVTTCNGPINGAAASPCFPVGGLLLGATYVATPGASLALIGAAFPPLGNTSKVLGPNAFSDTFNMTFASATAVGFDVFPGLAAGNVAITVFDVANLPLGSFTIAAPVAGGTFFGVLSDAALIGRINVASQSASPGELVDNVAFGISQVPEPTTAVLIGFGLTLLMSRLRRRSS